jgi:ferrochelatase
MPDSASVSTGILLVNLGTPDNPSPEGVRRFLNEMLSDRRIVDLPKLLWWPVLHGIVLRTRPAKSAEAYRKIWTPEGSPQMALGRRLIDRLRDSQLTVEMGMTYRRPSISEGLNALLEAGVGRVVVLPLFPQYSGATTGAVFDQVSADLRRRRWIPELKFISDYHAAPGYIEALRQSALEHWRTHERPEHLMMSFHGLPKVNVERGDPYRTQCETTARLLAQALDLRAEDWSLSFQSRFGAQEWLKPYTDQQFKALARKGVRRLGVICPGFAIDCLETLEEIAIRGAETFRGQGGGSLDYIPALNDRADHAACLTKLVEP